MNLVKKKEWHFKSPLHLKYWPKFGQSSLLFGFKGFHNLSLKQVCIFTHKINLERERERERESIEYKQMEILLKLSENLKGEIK